MCRALLSVLDSSECVRLLCVCRALLSVWGSFVCRGSFGLAKCGGICVQRPLLTCGNVSVYVDSLGSVYVDSLGSVDVFHSSLCV